jgi:hypothetical protein
LALFHLIHNSPIGHFYMDSLLQFQDLPNWEGYKLRGIIPPASLPSAQHTAAKEGVVVGQHVAVVCGMAECVGRPAALLSWPGVIAARPAKKKVPVRFADGETFLFQDNLVVVTAIEHLYQAGSMDLPSEDPEAEDGDDDEVMEVDGEAGTQRTRQRKTRQAVAKLSQGDILHIVEDVEKTGNLASLQVLTVVDLRSVVKAFVYFNQAVVFRLLAEQQACWRKNLFKKPNSNTSWFD